MSDISVVERVFEKVSRKDLCAKLGLSKQTMTDWKRWGYIPARHAAAIEAITGIPREELCPQFDWGGKVEG